MHYILLAILALSELPASIEATGTVCRLNRNAERFIVGTDDGKRVAIALNDSTNVTWEKAPYNPDDIRPGDRVHFVGTENESRVDVTAVDVQLKVAETIVDALLGVKPPLVGRFSTREAKTEFFSLRLPDGNYIRVDAKGAYGPKGRVWVSTLKSGDLLTLTGSYTSNRAYRASGIRILTNEESSKCRRIEGETKEQKESRIEAEQKFLDGYDPISDEELEP